METSYSIQFPSLTLAKVLSKCNQSMQSHHCPSSHHWSQFMTKSSPTWDTRALWLGGNPLTGLTPSTFPKKCRLWGRYGEGGLHPPETQGSKSCAPAGAEALSSSPVKGLEPPFSPSLLWSSPFVWHAKVCNCTRGLTFPKSLCNTPQLPCCKEQGRCAFPAGTAPRKQSGRLGRACACCKWSTTKAAHPHCTSTQPVACNSVV